MTETRLTGLLFTLLDKSRTELRRLGASEKRAPSRLTPVANAPKGLDTSADDLYILIETEELVYLLEVTCYLFD